ncbi:hypothetical protein SDRG_14257 [Saprolegnia diclina VS20]|uniref:Uncharacterized protein n=1 Tax=Saprolegnia diclina (strain VS20) TaxID=1156394 RepID=T0REH9_SAPDV|nr:hypothetical protein SDRG_14257 [Saprolegnia diclina VS20]EQC27982.1 hypothetical protein SDRG_14257 [Saprolegnia diclina VS20]|eukprot:XP_008618595.1 hypothetical protein SDRG_14257 [Saprolegnia diclina VS20]
MDTDPLLPKTPPPPYVPTAWRSPLLPLCEWHYLDGFTSCCCPCLALADVAGHIDACGGFYTTLASAGLLVELILVLQVLASSSVVLRGLGLVALLGYLLLIASLRTSVRRALKIRGSELGDALASGLCPCCTIVQMTSEVRQRSPPTDLLVAYLPE